MLMGGNGGSRALADFARGIRSPLDQLKLYGNHDPLGDLIRSPNASRSSFYDLAKIQPIHFPKPHHPEGFYYDKWPTVTPVKRGSLTCDLFRHHREEEVFTTNVVFPADGDASGAVKCIVEAENLTKPVEVVVPVSRKINAYSLLAAAEEMISKLQS